jgi:2-methylisocitrate lyase-like PEP mutase family enzyme
MTTNPGLSSKLSELLSADSTTLTTGVYDPLSAKLAERAGFQAVMLSGYSVAAAYLGVPDFGLLSQTEMLDVARRTVAATDMAVLVDGDTGYGGPLNVQRHVRELTAMGAAGVFLEDQVWPKRCGHMRDKAVIPAEEHAEKIRAAVEARGESRRGEFLIVGRTDARAPLGLDEALRRGNLYREAGADVVFVEAPQSIDELHAIRRSVDGPILANMVEGGRTPLLGREELREIGFEAVVFPLTALLASTRAIEVALARLQKDGHSRAIETELKSFDEFGEVVGLEDHYREEARFRSGGDQ